jgi:hypothetical protein
MLGDCISHAGFHVVPAFAMDGGKMGGVMRSALNYLLNMGLA